MKKMRLQQLRRRRRRADDAGTGLEPAETTAALRGEALSRVRAVQRTASTLLDAIAVEVE